MDSFLTKNDISELKTYKNPPKKILMVLSALMILLRLEPEWNTIKKCLGSYLKLNFFFTS